MIWEASGRRHSLGGPYLLFSLNTRKKNYWLLIYPGKSYRLYNSLKHPTWSTLHLLSSFLLSSPLTCSPISLLLTVLQPHWPHPWTLQKLRYPLLQNLHSKPLCVDCFVPRGPVFQQAHVQLLDHCTESYY